MSIKSKIGEWLGFKSTPLVISGPDELARIFGAEFVTGTGQPVTPLRAMQLAIVFSCVRVLSESMGMLPCRLYKQEGRYKHPAVNHKLYELLSLAPNDYMTAQEFWELLMVCLCLRGNFYAYKFYAFGEVVELLPLDPSSVTPKLKDDWTVEYQVNFKNGGIKTLSQNEIWHVRLFTLDGLTGLNPVAYARKCIGLGLDTEEHGATLFKNGAVTSGVLETEESLTDVAFKRLKTEFEENYTGLANTYKPSTGQDYLKISPAGQSEVASFLNPDVLIIILGTNDYRRGHSVANYQAGIMAMIDGFKSAVPNCAVILIAPAQSSVASPPIPLVNFVEAAFELTYYRQTEIYNMFDDWGAYDLENTNGQWADSLHISKSGAYRLSRQIYKRFLEL